MIIHAYIDTIWNYVSMYLVKHFLNDSKVQYCRSRFYLSSYSAIMTRDSVMAISSFGDSDMSKTLNAWDPLIVDTFYMIDFV